MRSIYLILGVLCFSIIAYGYDWTDSDFNMILQEDLLDNLDTTDEDSDPVHHRFARDTKPENKTDCDPKQTSNDNSNRYQRACCGDRDDLKMHGEALRQLRRECFADIRKARKSRAKDEEAGPVDIFSCEKITKNKEDMICVMECIGRKKNMVDAEGNLLPGNVTEFVKRELATKDWQKEIIDNVLDKCLQNKTKTIQNSTVSTGANSSTTDGNTAESKGKSNNSCNMDSLKFSHCLWREVQLSCPKNLTKNTKACQRMRERLMKKEYPDFERKSRPRQGGNKRRNNKKEDEE